jgi:hypothetical protein
MEAKGERDSGQMQATGEEKQTQTNAGTFESNNVCAVDCDKHQRRYGVV